VGEEDEGQQPQRVPPAATPVPERPPGPNDRNDKEETSSSSSVAQAAPASHRAVTATSKAFKHDEETVKLRAVLEAAGLLEALQVRTMHCGSTVACILTFP
jgi:hypothetical protein